MSPHCDGVQHHAGGCEFTCKKCGSKYCVLCSGQAHHGTDCEDAKVERKRLAMEMSSALEDAEYDVVEKCEAPVQDSGIDWDMIELGFDGEDLGA